MGLKMNEQTIAKQSSATHHIIICRHFFGQAVDDANNTKIQSNTYSKLLNTIIIVMFLNLIHNNELFYKPFKELPCESE